MVQAQQVQAQAARSKVEVAAVLQIRHGAAPPTHEHANKTLAPTDEQPSLHTPTLPRSSRRRSQSSTSSTPRSTSAARGPAAAAAMAKGGSLANAIKRRTHKERSQP